MRCEEVKNSIMAYINGKLPGEKADTIKAHLHICPLCREFYADEIEMVEAFTMDTTGFAGDGFLSNVMAKIDSAGKTRSLEKTVGFKSKIWLFITTKRNIIITFAIVTTQTIIAMPI